MRASVIVVGFGPEPHLEACLNALAAEVAEHDEIVLVDNGISDAESRAASWPDGVRRVITGRNVGFAGGVNRGVEESTGTFVVLVNADAIVQPGAIDPLIRMASQEPPTLAAGCLRLAGAPNLVNSAGNPLHYLGLCWSGGYGEEQTRHSVERDVATASGGFMALRRSLWDYLEGFNANYFAYHEDVEFSARVWLSGGKVCYTPDASADHHYDFGRNSLKLHLLERNRLMTVVTLYPRGLLIKVLPMLIVGELGILALAVKEGWLRDKTNAYRWLWQQRRELCQRRSRVMSTWHLSPGALTPLLATHIEPGMLKSPRGLGLINSTLSTYWHLANARWWSRK